MLCPVCSMEIKNWMNEYMVATEIPYTNVYLHLECKKTINLEEFVVNNAEKWYTIYIEQLQSKTKKEKYNGK